MLDPLRGLAACAVMYYHFTNAGTFLQGGGYGYALLRAPGIHGGQGVYAFFVISGFVLPYSLLRAGYRPRDYGRFVCKRILRLDPPYLCTLVLAVGLALLGPLVPGYMGAPFHLDWTRFLLHLGYLNAFSHLPWYNPAFWTLAVEFQFYLAVGLLFPLAVHRRPAVRLALPLALGALAFASSNRDLVVHHLALFALGIATAQHHVGLVSRRVYLATGALLSAALVATLGPVSAGVGIATAALIAGLGHAGPDSRAGRWVRLRPLVWLGAISYSIYLLHIPIGTRVLSIGDRFADSVPAMVAVLAAGIAVTLAASHVMYRLVELPSQRLSSRIRYSGRAAPVAPVPFPVRKLPAPVEAAG